MMTFTIISAIIFFSFVVLNVCMFGLKEHYSAYARPWMERSKVSGFNLWSFITILSALLLLPPLLTSSEGSIWQFMGFLCPACITFVGLTPSGNRSKLATKIHSICAPLAALWAILYIFLNVTSFWWIVPTYAVLAGVCTLIFGKWSWDFWFEMAAYLCIYTTLFLIG